MAWHWQTPIKVKLPDGTIADALYSEPVGLYGKGKKAKQKMVDITDEIFTSNKEIKQ